MNTNKRTQRVPTRFSDETQFLVPIGSVPFRGLPEHQLEQLKEQLLQPLLEACAHTQLHEPLRQAAAEAATLAWLTPFPLLVLPELFEEKARSVKHRIERQKRIRRRSEVLLSEAV